MKEWLVLGCLLDDAIQSGLGKASGFSEGKYICHFQTGVRVSEN
jgi:hypothetical protein